MLSTTKTVNNRIERIRNRYQDDIPVISIERAKYFTEKWLETETSNLPRSIRVALSMKHVYDNMTHYVDPEDKIAGYWTEHFLGVPIEIERGVYNTVYKNELKWSSQLKFRIKSLLISAIFLIKKRQFGNFRKNVKITKSMGSQPMNLGLKTMSKREINPYTIGKKEKKILLKKLLPKWKNKTIIEIVEKTINNSGLLKGSVLDFNAAIPANSSRQTMMISLCSTIATYQGHLILDFETLIKKGLLNIKKEVQIVQQSNPTLSKEEKDFLESISIAIDGIITYSRRLTEKLERRYSAETDSERKMRLKNMLDNCKKVPIHPADTFYEAVQAAWILKVAVELAHPLNLHSFGRMDQILYSYYEKDVENGTISKDEARDLLAELLLKVMALNIRPESNIIGNFYHRFLGSSPITLGGLKPDGTDGTNDLTFLFIEAANLSRAVTNISLRLNELTPDDVLLKVIEVLSEGSSNLSIFNDDVNIEAMKRRGFSEEDARDYAVMGCVELLCPAKTGSMSANAILLCRLLDMTLRNGDAQTLMGIVKGTGLKTGNPDSFKSFNELLDAVITQAKDQTKLIAEASNLRDKIFAELMPAPYISAFMDGCLQSKKDITKGGAKYDLSGISYINSIANLTDSLYVIKKLIFDEKVTTFKELLDAIDNNYIGYEELHKKIVKVEGKWGNGNGEVDDLAKYLSTQLFQETYNYKNFRGGPFVPYLISMTTHTIDGRISIATPDGRLAASPYAASCNPYNVEKSGVTAVFRSVSALDFKNALGCAVNVKFHPTALGKNLETRKKWISLIRTYFKLGGAQVQPTVVSTENLLDAQKHPENYKDLLVKVGGYSAYFTELGIEIQNEVIARTQHDFCN